MTDADQDGDLDVLAASELDDTVAWYENADGAGFSWTEHALTTGAAEPQAVVAMDLDRDGDVDAVVASGRTTRCAGSGATAPPR